MTIAKYVYVPIIKNIIILSAAIVVGGGLSKEKSESAEKGVRNI